MTVDEKIRLVEGASEDEPVHVYPLYPVPDMQHGSEPVALERPLPDCWLCQNGICVQAEVADGVVLHATWGAH